MGFRTTVQQTPFHDPVDHSQQADHITLTLDEKLMVQVKHSHQRVRREAWGWFADGEYRRALRSFETAVILESNDHESRIGMLFSQLSLGATNSAIAILREFYRHDINPFVYDFSLVDRFGDKAEARKILFRTRSMAEASRDNHDISALYAFVLWQMGDRNEAIAVMKTSTREDTRTPYHQWLAKMQLAASSLRNSRGGDRP